jgi:D-alanine-D-alanine ligase
LFEQAEIMMGDYAGALIEEFIEGLECTVLVADNPEDWSNPLSYQPMKYRFPEGETFKHYFVKWEDYADMHATPVTDPELDRRLRQAAIDFYRGMNGVGYGRCDVRVDKDGRPFMLEINANCGLYYPADDAGSADLCLLNDPAGHEGFTRQVVAAALARHAERRKGWVVRSKNSRGYGLFVTRSYSRGERVVSLEGQRSQIVTRRHVESSWEEPYRSWFKTRAWPITDEVWVVWSPHPEDWTPIDHGCDPSCWLSGLDIVARRKLAAGDEITLDYATMYNEIMPDFECDCESAECRGTVRGTDHLEDFVDRYGDHVSDYVRNRRSASRG